MSGTRHRHLLKGRQTILGPSTEPGISDWIDKAFFYLLTNILFFLLTSGKTSVDP